MKPHEDTTVRGQARQPLGAGPFNRFLLLAGRRLKGLYLSAVGSWTVIYALPLVLGLVISRLIDRAGTGSVDSGTWWLLVLAVGLMAVRAVVLWGGLQLTFVLIFKTSAWLKVRALFGLLGRPQARNSAASSGDTINRLRDDTDEIGGLLEWTTDLIYRSVLLVVAVSVLIATDVVMSIPLVLLLGGLLASVSLKNRVASLQTQTRVQQGLIGGAITDTLTGIRDLRLSGAITGRMARLERSFAERRRVQQRHQVFADLLSDLFRNLVVIGTAVVLLTATVRIGSGDLTIGDLVLFMTYSSWLGQQMFFFGKILARYQSGKVSHHRLTAMSNGAEPTAHHQVPVEPLRELTVIGLTRGAPDGGPAPEPVDLSLRPGQLVAITGDIGAGKSTVVRALLALQPDAAGQVRWNDTDITGDRTRLGTPHVSYARQSPRFVVGTVRDNLRLGDDGITEERMHRALTAVHLRPGTSELPEGLDTFLDSGEASRLSGGQRQRLALARMLCRPAELYVVDDCDSSLDGPTARDIWQNVPRMWPGAWVVVSHNPDLLAQATTVVRVNRLPDPSLVTAE